MKAPFPVVVLLENIRSLHNVGSVFRSSDAVGVQKVFLTGYTGTPPRIQISKVALGAEELIPWKHYKRPSNALRALRKEGYTLVALETGESSENLFTFKPSWPLCLMLGNEVDGLSEQLLEEADAVVHLPMEGMKESLNVSCAYTAAVYELYRKYAAYH